MSQPYCYKYPRPAVTVDLVTFAFDGSRLRILLIRRGKAPFAGHWAIPGGFLEIDEPIEVAARRELQEETRLTPATPVELIGVFGAPGRDPRGRTISLAHATAIRGPASGIRGGDDASQAAWFDPFDPPALAFDHAAILATALEWLRGEVAEGPAALTMLGASFDDREIKALHQALGLGARAAVNWRARMRREGRIEPAGSRQGKYRAAALANHEG